MTRPQRLPEPSKLVRANWLGRYLDVEKGYDKDLRSVLLDSLSGIDEALERVGDGFSKRIRRQQLALSNKAIRSTMHNLFGDVGNLIRDYKPDAAVAAVESELYDQRGILARVFKDPVHRAQYADSLKATASRNIDAVMTRVLETEKPLSQRVYRTEALANGQVSKILNRALAKGDSAANIARDVRGLIDPDTPGGVSYAARRLGRTEINNAFHAQSIHDAQNSPFVKSMRWNLSKAHEPDNYDLCEIYSVQGIFVTDQVPEKPHPNCRCFVTPELEDYSTFETALVSGQYDSYLDSVLGFEDEPRSASELSPEAQARIDAILKRSEDKVALDKANADIEKAKAQRGFEAEQKRQAEAKAARDAKRVAAQKIQNEKELERERLRSFIDIDETIPESIEKASSAKQVANWLQDSYDGLSIQGFETGDIDQRFAKEVARAFVSQQAEHPRTNIRALKIAELPEGETARTVFNQDRKKRSDILFNRSAASNYEGYLEESKKNQKTNWHGKRDMSEPFVGNFNHEWGHVLSFSGEARLEDGLKPLKIGKKQFNKVGEILKDDFIVEELGLDPRWDDVPQDLQSRYEAWVLNGLPSGYSFEDKNRTKIDAVESVAEGYADSVMNPNASAFSKTVRRKLIQYIEENNGLVVGVGKKKRRAKK